MPLHVVTKDGAVCGRLNKNGVYLPHMSISKEHCHVRYSSTGPGSHHYFVQDLGSNNGTYVNGSRLSSSKTPSGPKEVG